MWDPRANGASQDGRVGLDLPAPVVNKACPSSAQADHRATRVPRASRASEGYRAFRAFRVFKAFRVFRASAGCKESAGCKGSMDSMALREIEDLKATRALKDLPRL